MIDIWWLDYIVNIFAIIGFFATVAFAYLIISELIEECKKELRDEEQEQEQEQGNENGTELRQEIYIIDETTTHFKLFD